MEQMIVNEKRTFAGKSIGVVFSIVFGVIFLTTVIPVAIGFLAPASLAPIDELFGLNGTNLALEQGLTPGGIYWKILGITLIVEILLLVFGGAIVAFKKLSGAMSKM